MKHRVPRRRLWLLALVASAALAACKEEAKTAPDVRPVRVMQVGGPAAQAGAELAGTVRAHVETPLSFRIGGKLIERRVDIGSVVRRGAAIARIDPQDASLNAAAADAQLASANARLAQARMDHGRSVQLFAQKFVSQAEVDNRKTALDAAREAARQAAAQRDLARNQAGYTTLMADADGVITEVLAEPGQVVAAGQGVAKLARDGVREIALDVPEQLRGAVKVGDAVLIRIWALPGREIKGHVSELSPAADAAARTYPARVAFDEAVADVQLGMSASVRLAQAGSVTANGRIRVPLTALFGNTGAQKVWRFDAGSGTVKAVPVKVAALVDDAALIEGVRPGDLVVTAGVHLLREGQQVKRLADAGAGV